MRDARRFRRGDRPGLGMSCYATHDRRYATRPAAAPARPGRRGAVSRGVSRCPGYPITCPVDDVGPALLYSLPSQPESSWVGMGSDTLTQVQDGLIRCDSV